MMKSRFLTWIMLVCSLFFNVLHAADKKQYFGVVEKDGSYIPDSIYVFDEDSNRVNLNSLINKPTLLAFVYYKCPGLCPMRLMGITELINHAQVVPGIDYQIITISIDHRERPSVARATKAKYFQLLKRKIDPDAWRFFTADSLTIRKLTDSTGWDFREVGKDFVHTSATILLTSGGMISQYFYNTYYNYMYFDMAVKTADEKQTAPTRISTLKYCYNFKPPNNKATVWITDIFGVLCIIGVFFLFLYVRRKPTVKN